MTPSCGGANKSKSPTAPTEGLLAFTLRGSAMSAQNKSPITVEILARIGGNLFRVRLGFSIEAIAALFSAVSRLIR